MNYDSKMPGANESVGKPAEKSGEHVPLSNETHSMVDAHSIRTREAERARLRADIDAFLAEGGKVTHLEANRRVDLPKAPQNNYGKGSI